MSSQQQQQTAALYSLQQHQFRELRQTPEVFGSAPRKRKLPSVALCIKDGRVYSKPFSSLPSSVVGNNNKSIKADVNAPPQPQQVYKSTLNHQLDHYPSNLNPHKRLLNNPIGKNPPQVNPYQPNQTMISSVDQFYQRFGQKPPVVCNEDSNSVEDYRSEEDQDIMDGDEVNDDVSRDESYRSDEDDDIRPCDEDSNKPLLQKIAQSNKIEVNQISAESNSSIEDTYSQAGRSSNETCNDMEEACEENYDEQASEEVNALEKETLELPRQEDLNLTGLVQSASDIMPGNL